MDARSSWPTGFTAKRITVGMVLALVLAAGAPAATAGASGALIGPDQAFVGSVDGQFSHATIQMACFGPIQTGQMGHPMAGQMLEVYSPPPPISYQPGVKVGYTGDAGTSIVAMIASSGTSYGRVRLSEYFTQVAIPTTLLLPCGGGGVVRFQPRPTSPSAKHGAVSVTFVGQP